MKTANISKERMYDIIRGPVITEKSTLGSEHGQVTFRVSMDATKPEIAAAVEGLFDVKVNAVNTLRQSGKVKRFRGRLGRRVLLRELARPSSQETSRGASTGTRGTRRGYSRRRKRIGPAHEHHAPGYL